VQNDLPFESRFLGAARLLKLEGNDQSVRAGAAENPSNERMKRNLLIPSRILHGKVFKCGSDSIMSQAVLKSRIFPERKTFFNQEYVMIPISTPSAIVAREYEIVI
jgi:hypothetical protein